MQKLKKIMGLPADVYLGLINGIPGPLGNRLRYYFWKPRLKFLGKKATIDVGVYFQNAHNITIDDNAWIDRHVMVMAGPPGGQRITREKVNPDFKLQPGEVYIGKNTHIAPNCVLSGIGGLYIGMNAGVASGSKIYSFSHHYRNLVDREDAAQYSFTPMARHDQQSMLIGPIVIEDYCGVGLNSIILPGTTLRRGAWVASGTIVSGTFEAQTLVSSGDTKLNTKSLGNLTIKE